jgi:hypothetical protein
MPRKKQSGYDRAASIRASARTELAKRYPSSSAPRPRAGQSSRSYQKEFLDVISEGVGGNKPNWKDPYAIAKAAEEYSQMTRVKPRTGRKTRGGRKKSKPAIDFGNR